MEENNEENVLYEIKPDFNFLYEIFMPTGRKIKSTIIVIFILILLTLILVFNGASMDTFSIRITQDLTLFDLLKYIGFIALGICVVKLIVHIVIQNMQYKHISYKFYEDHMVYEDNFLNQHRKNIEYTNVKEIEIRRTIWDRILGYGVIIIYTNAENKRNGLVIYALHDPQKSYDIIYEIVHKKQKEVPTAEKISESEKEEEEFKNSIKN
ncbi:MAG: PH domain-containing protein [Clostridia bacterium]|nr:PH domain-containing protein [Clostridia bacterium]